MTSNLNLSQIFKMMRAADGDNPFARDAGCRHTLEWDGEKCTTHRPEELHVDLRKTLVGLPPFRIEVQFRK